MDQLPGSAGPPGVPTPRIGGCPSGLARLPGQGLANAKRRLKAAVKISGYFASAAAALAVGGYAAAALGMVIAGLLVVIATPIIGFTRNQVRLTNKGRDMARTVEEVLSLKEADAAAFSQPLAAVFQRRPAEHAPFRQLPFPTPYTMDAQASQLTSLRSWANANTSIPGAPSGDTTITPVQPHGGLRPTQTRGDQGRHRGRPVSRADCCWKRPSVHNFWQSLTPKEQRALMALAHERTFAVGAILCREDEPARNVMVIRSGWTKIYVGKTGRKRIIARRGPGELIGERAAFAVRSRSATVIADSIARVLVIATEDFRVFLDDHPRVLVLLEQQVYDRLTEDHAAPQLTRTAASQRCSAGSTLPPSWASQNCSILFTDITSFGAHTRDDEDRRTVRQVLYGILRNSFERSNVPWRKCYREDRGDGALIIIPARIPTSSVVDPLLASLVAALRRHNHQASEAIRIQLRLALHVGPVVPDSEGVSGESVIFTARLLEAPPLKKELAKSAANLGFIVSPFVYNTVIKHGPGYVDPAAYQRVRFQGKESKITAWLYLAGTGRYARAS